MEELAAVGREVLTDLDVQLLELRLALIISRVPQFLLLFLGSRQQPLPQVNELGFFNRTCSLYCTKRRKAQSSQVQNYFVGFSVVSPKKNWIRRESLFSHTLNCSSILKRD